MLLGWSSHPVVADWLEQLQPIATAQQVRNLSPDEARAGRLVKLTGVITHINPFQNDFFLQDATAGIYVRPTPLAAELKLGDRIVLEGKSDPADFAPCVSATRVTSLGEGKLPDPLPFNMSAEDSRWMAGQWVQVLAVVRNVRTVSKATYLDVYTTHGSGVVVIPGDSWASAAMKLKDVAVTVRGVCVPTFTDRIISGSPKIHATELPSARDRSIDESQGPEIPSRKIDYLLRFFSPAPHPGALRVKIGGVVTATPLPGVVIVQDDTGGAAVWTTIRRTDIPIGTRIEAYGLLQIHGRRISLKHSKVALLGTAPLPPALPITGTELATGLRDSLMVRLEARVETVRDLIRWSAVMLVDGVVRFEVYVPGSLVQNKFDRLEKGSRVTVVGVPVDASPDGKPGVGPGLFLPTAESLTLLELPPKPTLAEPTWWSTTRVTYLCGGFLAVMLLGSGWLFILRHQVRKAAAEVKRQYDEKGKLENQLRHAAKLEAVGRLAGGIAHDFNNLLTVINGCAELLEEEHSLKGGRIGGLVEDIRKAGERAASLTGQLLTFSRKRDVPVTAVNLSEIVTDTVRLLDRVIGENILIQTHFAADLPSICGEPGLLHQVVMNLAVNAKDAMPGGGTLTLTTSRLAEPVVATPQSSASPAVTIRQYVRLTVSDTGMGMTDEVKARIFEPFFTTKEIGTGTGLGLATVYGIIKTIRGKIRVESVVGHGTTFHIDLRIHGVPGADSDSSIPGVTSQVSRRVSGISKLTGKTILVVEDNDMVRDTLVSGLTTDGATVLSAENPNQALKVLADYPSQVDIMVTDVVMPGMSGRKLADRVRMDRPAVQVVFMSGYTADEVLREGVLADQVEFLQKPFTPDHLITRLIGVLERRPKIVGELGASAP
jgi:two-component system cell cycle sensor histidine kinase/response regulator CckA